MRRVLLCAIFFLITAGAWAATGTNRSTGRRSGAGQTQRHATRSVKPDAVLFGDKTIESSVDRDTAGSVKAFRFVDETNGTARSISIYVASHSRARTLLVGLYSNKSGDPGSLLASASLSAPKSARWNKVTIKSTAVKAGQDYWVAVLNKGGTLYFRDRSKGVCTSENARAIRPTALPRSTRKGRRSKACPISAYVSGQRAQPAGGGTQASAGQTVKPLTDPSTRSIATSPPGNTGLPTITGTAQQGQTLTASRGSWSGSPTAYAYRWQHCYWRCSNIKGATGSSYPVQASDVGDTIDVVVTATNAGGSASANSAKTTKVGRMASPTNITAPSLTGAAQAGPDADREQRLVDGQPDLLRLSVAGLPSNCANISGATGSTYTLQAADVGDTIDVVVTATNTGGSGAATSARRGAVQDPPPPPPSNTAAPTISGTRTAGPDADRRQRQWTGSPTSYAYQWQDCTATGCTNITGAAAGQLHAAGLRRRLSYRRGRDRQQRQWLDLGHLGADRISSLAAGADRGLYL